MRCVSVDDVLLRAHGWISDIVCHYVNGISRSRGVLGLAEDAQAFTAGNGGQPSAKVLRVLHTAPVLGQPQPRRLHRVMSVGILQSE
jgi:hypothetical protein